MPPVAELQGFMLPCSPEGEASIVPPPPWHYSGRRADRSSTGPIPRTSRRCCQTASNPPPEDPGAVAMIWADWQSCTTRGEELLDPVRSQYKECFVVVRCEPGGRDVLALRLIWVDKDFALARGWYQGYPKKLGRSG